MRKPAVCILCENKGANQLHSCTAQFVSDLVGNPEDRVSGDEAHIDLF